MKHKKQIMIVVLMLLLTVVVILGVFVFRLMKDRINDKNNRKTIQAVVTQLLTCPNEELIGLYKDMYYKTTEASEKRTDLLTSPENILFLDSSKIEEALGDNFMPYFTNRGYASFERWFLINDHVYSTALGYSIIVNKIEIIRSEEMETNYSFIAYLTYGLTGSIVENIEIKGSAQFYEQVGRLSYLKLFDRQLNQELRNKVPSL